MAEAWIGDGWQASLRRGDLAWGSLKTLVKFPHPPKFRTTEAPEWLVHRTRCLTASTCPINWQWDAQS
eukprot:4142680-Amphidinium_carterae.1